jgi:predicted metal-dependent hydrolase
MGTRLELGDLAVEVAFKDIKNVHLSVHPPAGRVTISAPRRTKLDTLRVFAISKLGWIKQQQQKIRSQDREPEREYLDRETHYVWGRRCLLAVSERDEAPSVALRHSTLALTVRPGTDTARRHALVDAWYRAQIRQALPALAEKWQPIVGAEAAGYYVQRMRTRWGSCNPAARTVRLNTDLAKKPRECLEYILVHELVHLIEPTHNARFVALMDKYMPRWQDHRAALNRLPVRHEEWGY